MPTLQTAVGFLRPVNRVGLSQDDETVISKNVTEDLRRMVMMIISLLSSFFIVFNCYLSVVLELDKGDYPKYVQIVCLSHNK